MMVMILLQALPSIYHVQVPSPLIRVQRIGTGVGRAVPYLSTSFSKAGRVTHYIEQGG